MCTWFCALDTIYEYYFEGESCLERENLRWCVCTGLRVQFKVLIFDFQGPKQIEALYCQGYSLGVFFPSSL